MTKYRNHVSVCGLVAALALVGSLYVSACIADEKRDLFTAENPQPEVRPTLGMWEEFAPRQQRTDRFVSATFPNLPDFTCDLWCFESDGITFTSGRPIDDGGIQMRHAWAGNDWEIMSTVTPLPGCVDFIAQLAPTESATASEPGEYPKLNICWQLRRATRFASDPDPYPEFVKRCFIFTAQGRKFLNDTERRPIPARPLADKKNNPPWVQMYLPESAPAGIRAKVNAWADYSPDRYTLPIIGAVSRDGKFLTALATGGESMICQAWHDCMHNNARWLPDGPGGEKTWHVRIYVMENDPDALIARFKHDFPRVRPWE